MSGKLSLSVKPTRVLIRERSDFIRDRYGHNHNPAALAHGQPVLSKISYMAAAKGYVMVLRPGCLPFVLTEKQWLDFPMWDADQHS